MKVFSRIKNSARVVRLVLALSALAMFVVAAGAPHGHH